MSETGTPSSFVDLTRQPWRTFFGAPLSPDLERLEAEVAFLGVPFDQATVVPVIRSGTFGAPRAIREAYTHLSRTLPDGTSAGWFDIEDERMHLEGVRMADCGDVMIAAGDSEGTLDRITEAARRIAARVPLVVSVGGDHSIAYPVGRGVMERHENVDVVYIDAHPDFRDEWFGSRYSHGSALRRLSELPNVEHVSLLGLRVVDRTQYEDMNRLGVAWSTTRQILDEGPAAVVDRVVRSGRKLYVSIDIDVLDAAIVPGTTLPEPGGISYRQLRELLAAIAGRGEILGFDIVELSSAHDLHDTTARISAWTVVHFLSAIFDARDPTRPR
jgi:agmatinase